MRFINYIASSLAAILLCSCDSDQYVLAFNTESVPAQVYYLESHLNSFVPVDSSQTPESLNAQLLVVASNTLLTSYDDGTAKFELKVDSVDYKSDKRTVEEFSNMESLMATENFQYKMAGDGNVSSPVFEDSLFMGTEALDLVRLFLKIQPVLPKKTVAVGETWERATEIPSKSGYTTVYKSFKFVDHFIRDGIQFAKIDVNLKYKEVPEASSGVRMESKGFIIGSGNILFDMTHGVIADGNLELTGDLKMSDLISDSVIPDMRVIQKIKLRSEI